MLRVDLMSTKISNNKVKQEVTGFFQMNENGEVSYHKLKKQFIKEILEFGIIAPVNGKPTNLFPSDGRIFMEGLRVQYSGSRVTYLILSEKLKISVFEVLEIKTR